IFRAAHQCAIVLQKVVLVIAGDADRIRHRKQKSGKPNAVRALVDDVAEHIQLVPAAKLDLVKQAAEQVVMTVDVRNAIVHTVIISHRRGKFNETPCASAVSQSKRRHGLRKTALANVTQKHILCAHIENLPKTLAVWSKIYYTI